MPPRHILFRFAAVAWAVLIFLLSAQTLVVTPQVVVGQDKIAHLLLYGILGFFVANGMREAGVGLAWKDVVLAMALITLYGVSDEMHQSFVPGRNASAGDLVADCVGGFMAIGYVWNRRAKRA